MLQPPQNPGLLQSVQDYYKYVDLRNVLELHVKPLVSCDLWPTSLYLSVRPRFVGRSRPHSCVAVLCLHHQLSVSGTSPLSAGSLESGTRQPRGLSRQPYQLPQAPTSPPSTGRRSLACCRQHILFALCGFLMLQ